MTAMVLLKFVRCPSCGSPAHSVNEESYYTCDECGFQFSKDGKIYGETMSRPTGIELFDGPKLMDASPGIRRLVHAHESLDTGSIAKFIEESGARIGNEWIDSEPSWIKVKVACEAAGILGPWEIVRQAGSLAGALKTMRSSLDKNGLEKFDSVLKSLDVTDGELEVLGKIVARALGND
jgi:hypothetical protein